MSTLDSEEGECRECLGYTLTYYNSFEAWWTDSVHSEQAAHGTNPDSPFSTISARRAPCAQNLIDSHHRAYLRSSTWSLCPTAALLARNCRVIWKDVGRSRY